jgi:hypothetical protein
MVMTRRYFVGSLCACILSFLVVIGMPLAQGRWNRDEGEKAVRIVDSEMQRDQDRLASDVSALRKSLGQHKSQEIITQLRYQVRQDWQQIVLDRGHSGSERLDQTSNLVNRRHKRNGQTG